MAQMRAEGSPFDQARVTTGLMCVVLIVTLPPLTPVLARQWDLLPLMWNIVCVAGVTLTLAITLIAWWDNTWARPAAWSLIVTTVVGLASLALLSTAGLVADHNIDPWLAKLLPITMAATVLISRQGRTVVLTAVAVSSATMVSRLALGWGHEHTIIGDVGFGWLTVAIGWAFLSKARQLEAEALQAHGNAVLQFARAREAEVLASAAVRWECFLHDEVLAVLGRAASGETGPQLRTAATHVIAQDHLGTLIQAPPLRDGLVEACLQRCPTARLSFDEAPNAVELPQPVVLALVEATHEALRNVTRHAYRDGPIGTVLVTARHDHCSVAVSIADDGVGFVVDSVPESRFGVSVSIHGRLESAGGTAHIDSAPGRGTVVRLGWVA